LISTVSSARPIARKTSRIAGRQFQRRGAVRVQRAAGDLDRIVEVEGLRQVLEGTPHVGAEPTRPAAALAM
jgi:hypothetical protein